jgi:hypothetical protein
MPKFNVSKIEFHVENETKEAVEIELHNLRHERFTVTPDDLEASSDFKRDPSAPSNKSTTGVPDGHDQDPSWQGYPYIV